MTLLSLVLIGSGCEEQIDPAKVPSNEGKQVEVSLNIGFADEVDGAGNGTSPATKSDAGSNRSAFEMLPIADVRTKAQEGKPDKIYNLEIIQYKSDGTAASQILGEQQIGQSFTVSLAAENQSKLLFIAWGSSSGFNTPTDKSLKAIQELKVKAKDSNINKIATDATGSALANMPYFLYLEDVNIVNVNGTNKIQSPEGKDVRLLLQRLAVKVQLDWSLSQKMIDAGYSLREVKLCQAPADYRLIPQAETTPQWGNVYPSSVAEFVDLYRLTGDELTASSTKTVWMPANSRGISPKATAPIYRNKENANPAATYAEFVVDHNTNGKNDQRLYYRAYLGGNTTDDFNLLENTNYHWIININTAEYTNDQRIQPLDLTPVFSENLQTTANCFMMKPGTNICFNPYKHEAGTGGWNTYLTSNGSSIQNGKTIDKVEVLWQSKDAGTSGDLVMGYVVSNDNHRNLVNVTDKEDMSNARIHVKVPVTNGGNAVIAAKNSSGEIVWSWHLWISDYVPVRINSYNEYEAAQQNTQNGTVHKYRSSAFEANGKYANCVMMDRDLGAMAGGYPALYKGENYTVRDNVETQGFLFQGARKDPFFISADGTINELDVIYNGDGISLEITNVDGSKMSNKYEYSIKNPLHLVYGAEGIGSGSNKWDNNGKKTIDDPCPDGWKVPLFDGGTSSNLDNSILAGFETGGNLIGSGENAEYVIKNEATFTYSSYYYKNKLYETNPNAADNDVNSKGGRLFYLKDKQTNMTIHNTVWFPVSAERHYNRGELGASTYAHIWFANPNSGNYMYGSTMKPNAIRVIHYGMGYAWPVRCIQDNKNN
ncbi:DUF4906 domain-containing protein [Parabacteroides sp.]